MFDESPGIMLLIMLGGVLFLNWFLPKIVILLFPGKGGKGELIAITALICGSLAGFGYLINNYLDPNSSMPALTPIPILFGVVFIVVLLFSGDKESR
jgi:hypothetical protein